MTLQVVLLARLGAGRERNARRDLKSIRDRVFDARGDRVDPVSKIQVVWRRNLLRRVVVTDIETVRREEPVHEAEAPVICAEEGVVERTQTGRRVSDRNSPLRERLYG